MRKPLPPPPPPPPRPAARSRPNPPPPPPPPPPLRNYRKSSPCRTNTAITTLPGAIHIPGWRRRRTEDDDDSESMESRRGEQEQEQEEQTTQNYTSSSTTSSHHHEIYLSAHVVDGNEMQRHAEFLYQQMLSQAVVAELIMDEEEMRHRARQQAMLEFQNNNNNNQAAAAVMKLQQQQDETINNINQGQKKRREQRLRLIAGCFFFLATAVITIVLIVTAFLLLSSGSRQATFNDDLQTSNNRSSSSSSSSIPHPTAVPSFTPIRSTPSAISSSPSTTPSSMPSAASSWRQIGNSIQGQYDLEFFGLELAFSGDGNTFVASAQNTGQVRAYSYLHHHGNSSSSNNNNNNNSSSNKNNETDKADGDDSSWEPLGPSFVMVDYGFEKISLSPNGKFVALINNYWYNGTVAKIRIFALRDNTHHKNNNNNNTNISDNFIWEQIGPDIVHSSSLFSSSSSSLVVDMESIMTASLTDNLVLAIGCSTGESGEYIENQGMVYMYQWNIDHDANNKNSTSWIPMGQAIQLYAWSLQLVFVQSNTTSSSNSSHGSTFETTTSSTMLILAVGGLFSARTFRYKQEMDSWTQFGSELVADDNDESYGFGTILSLSMTDGKTITVGVRNDDTMGQAIGLLRTFLYDTATEDWIQVEKDLKGSTFLFGLSFALSGNGKVLVTTTQELDFLVQSGTRGWVVGQIRTWDFISADEQNTSDNAPAGAGGNWIQRDAALEVGTFKSGFGFKIALSEDGNRLATSALYALNEQGLQTGKVRVYEQYQ